VSLPKDLLYTSLNLTLLGIIRTSLHDPHPYSLGLGLERQILIENDLYERGEAGVLFGDHEGD